MFFNDMNYTQRRGGIFTVMGKAGAMTKPGIGEEGSGGDEPVTIEERLGVAAIETTPGIIEAIGGLFTGGDEEEEEEADLFAEGYGASAEEGEGEGGFPWLWVILGGGAIVGVAYLVFKKK